MGDNTKIEAGASLNRCDGCRSPGPYSIYMTQDSWVAECRRCGKAIDIGQPPAPGYGLTRRG